MAIDRPGLMPVVRHECGHLVVARALGFPTDGIELLLDRAGAHIDLQPAFRSTDEVCSYIEKRVQVLFAGAIAQSIQGNAVRPAAAYALFNDPRDGAGHDFAKIKELIRILVGLKFPDASSEQYEHELQAANTRLSQSAAQIVSDNIPIIDALALRFLDEMESLSKQGTHHFTQEKLDEFLASR